MTQAELRREREASLRRQAAKPETLELRKLDMTEYRVPIGTAGQYLVKRRTNNVLVS